MRKTHKMKLVAEIVDILKEKGMPADQINHSTVSSWVMSQLKTDPYNEARYGGLRQGDFSLYFREFYGQEA